MERFWLGSTHRELLLVDNLFGLLPSFYTFLSQFLQHSIVTQQCDYFRCVLALHHFLAVMVARDSQSKYLTPTFMI